MPRVASAADAPAIAEVFALGFHDDPVWAWAFPDPGRRLAQHRRLWSLFVGSGIPHGWVWIAGDCDAAALWVPPGTPDLNERDRAAYEPLIREELGDRAEQVLALAASFDRNKPREPHYYLSLLATHPERRGRGLGTGLLAGNLARIDAEGMPAYLESTEPANDNIYERLGFARVGEFSGPAGGPTVGRMWRPVR